MKINIHRKFVKTFFVFGSLQLLTGLATLPAQTAGDVWQQEYGPTHEARIQWWRNAHFGMFIHWGIYSVPGGIWNGQQTTGFGEWIMSDLKIPVADYATICPEFNPTNFDAAAWVKLAKDSGMQYIVVTAKHHDGFAMYHSAVSKYNVYDATPFKRDPLKELETACENAGIKFGVYYSQAQDWHAPGGAAANGHWDPAKNGNFDSYLTNQAVPQVKELLTNYKPAILWFDTPVSMTSDRAKEFLPLYQIQPGLITNDRLDSSRVTGDYTTPEQRIPTGGFPGQDWETCMTINSTWGYESFDTSWKRISTLIHDLVDIASKGGNYLLNIGPTGDGTVPQPEIDRLKAMGQWLSVNGEAIYGTIASPLPAVPVWGRCTAKTNAFGTNLYLHVFTWPNNGSLVVSNFTGKIDSATLLATGAGLTTTVSGGNTIISVPATAPDAISSTIVLSSSGGFVKILNRNSGLALNVSGASTADGARLIQWPYSADANRNDEWQITSVGGSYYKIVNRKSSKVATVSGASLTNGAPVIQWTYTADSTHNDEWSVGDIGGGYWKILNRNSGQALNVSGASLTNGAPIIQWPYSNNSTHNDEWQILNVP